MRGCSNIYFVVLNNRKFNLLPQPWDVSTSPSTCLIVVEIEYELEDTNYWYALIAQGLLMTSLEDSLITSDGHTLLEEFTDVFPQELPPNLPPAMSAQHQIDLALGVSIPNRPHYQMLTDQHEELQ